MQGISRRRCKMLNVDNEQYLVQQLAALREELNREQDLHLIARECMIANCPERKQVLLQMYYDKMKENAGSDKA